PVLEPNPNPFPPDALPISFLLRPCGRPLGFVTRTLVPGICRRLLLTLLLTSLLALPPPGRRPLAARPGRAPEEYRLRCRIRRRPDRKSTRLNSSHVKISYA